MTEQQPTPYEFERAVVVVGAADEEALVEEYTQLSADARSDLLRVVAQAAGKAKRIAEALLAMSRDEYAEHYRRREES